MKKLIAASLILGALAIPVSAQAASNIDWCTDVSGGAHNVMEYRQSGQLASEFMQVMQSSDLSDGIKGTISYVLLAAYEVPQYPESMRADEADRFANEIFVDCMQVNQ